MAKKSLLSFVISGEATQNVSGYVGRFLLGTLRERLVEMTVALHRVVIS